MEQDSTESISRDRMGSLLDGIQEREKEFITFLDSLGMSRELSLAKTNVEQAALWASKFVREKT